MNTASLKLNDFESFEEFLFTSKERKRGYKRWKKYIKRDIIDCIFCSSIRESRFLQPIKNPKTIEEFQLCHYAYWMCIAFFSPTNKLLFHRKVQEPNCRCYACEFSPNCWSCPIASVRGIDYSCPDVYGLWRNCGEKDQASEYAKEIATIHWKNKN